MKISVIITNFNGKKLLKKNLPFVIKNSPEANEIIITDDASTDGSQAFLKSLKKKNKKIKLILHVDNIGFAANSNNAVKIASGDYVVLLNNDIKPVKNYIKNSLYHFKKRDLFGVGFSEVGRENWANIFWKDGYLQYTPGVEISQPHITGWLSGGSSIISKKVFLKLGGFDPIYYPFYSEDLDLGYRAWKSGYSLIWEPTAKVYHQHESTMSKFPKRFSDYVKERNRLIVVLRNITDKKFLFHNTITIFSRCLLGPNYIKIIRSAKREINKHQPPIVFPKLTDRQIFAKFNAES